MVTKENLMQSHFVKILMLLALSATLTQTTSARYSQNPKLGINVGGLGKLSSSIPFTDIFKISRGWFTSCEFDWKAGRAIDPGCTRKTALNTREQDILQLDGNGWVRTLPSPQEQPVFTSVTSTWRLSEHFPTGRYVVLYDGEGTMKISGDLRMGYQSPGHIEFDLLSPKRNLRLQITRTDPRRNGNYIRNIRIVPKKNEKNYQRQVFNPDYIARIREMHSLRFMPWSNPRSNETAEWNDRTKIGTAHYTSTKGVPVERMVDLANAINATPWLSIPYKASDDYMQKYARMVKNRLRKNQTVYVEYSNEVWNSIFPAATYAARKADALWKYPYSKVAAGKRRVLLSANWYAKRSVEMCNIFKKEFGGQSNRVKCVVGSLNSVPWVGKEILDCPLWKEAKGCGRHIDAYGIGPYFGDYIARKENRATVKGWTRNADGGKSRLFQEILHGGMIKDGPKGGSMTLLRDQLFANKKLADKYGLEMLAYEAGQHLIRYDPPHNVKDPAVLNLFMTAQKDPRMRQAYQQYLNTWAQGGGGLMLHFYGIGEPEPRNFFGMLDHLHQPSTPKYLALMEYLGSKSTYVPPTKKAYVAPPVVKQPAQVAVKNKVAQQQVVRQQQAPPPVANNERTFWDKFLYPDEPKAAPQPTIAPKQAQVVQQQRQPSHIFSGAGIRDWAIQGNTATSLPITIKRGARSTLSMLWHLENTRKSRSEFFRMYVIDNRGGRKIILNQPASDLAEVGDYDQLFEDDFSRYIGPPIRIMLETSPGVRAVVDNLSFK